MLEKGDRLERNALAAAVAHPPLVKLLAELAPEHFDSELHRRFRAHVVDGGELDGDLLALRAELDARGAKEGLDERTGKELLLNLRERQAAPGARSRRVRPDEGVADPARAGQGRDPRIGVTRSGRRYNPQAAFPRSSIGRASGC